MRLRNNIFAEAFKWLKKNWEGIKYQKDLAAKIGVSEDTITRIMRDQTEVTDDFLCKFNEAFNNVFNYQWLRGEDPEHMLFADVLESRMYEKSQKEMTESIPDYTSLFNATIAAKDDAIISLKRELQAKDQLINEQKARISEKDDMIELLKVQVKDLQKRISMRNIEDLEHLPFPPGVAEPYGDRERQKK